MGTSPKRAGGDADDAHAAIRDEADKARRLPAGSFSNAKRWPALHPLLTAGRAAVEVRISAIVDAQISLIVDAVSA